MFAGIVATQVLCGIMSCFCFPGTMFAGVVATQVLCGIMSCFCFSGTMFAGVVATLIIVRHHVMLLFSRFNVCRHDTDSGIVQHYHPASVFQVRCLQAW